MSTKPKRHSAEFKAKVALEAVKRVHRLQQLAKEFQVHPTQITIWKKQLTGQVASLFSEKKKGANLWLRKIGQKKKKGSKRSQSYLEKKGSKLGHTKNEKGSRKGVNLIKIN